MPHARSHRLPRTALLTLIACLVPLAAPADQVTIPVGQQVGRENAPLPSHGMTQTQVEKRFGAPQQRRTAVGEPPIARWDYTDYVVYFEHDRVLRAVVKHQPTSAPAASDG